MSAGDERALRVVYDRHARAVRVMLRARVGPDAAEDLLAQTFTVAWTSRERFDRSSDSARPWLYGIATKLTQRHATLEARWQQSIRASTNAAPSGSDVAPPDALDGSLDPALVAAIAELSPAEREVLLLVALGELRVTEAARAIGITPVAARIRLHKARRRIITQLEGASHD